MKETEKKTAKVVFRRAGNGLKISLILLILFSTAALVALRWVHNGIREQTEKLRSEAAAVEYANSELERKTANLDSVQSVQEIAKEELGLVDPRAVVVDPQS